MKHFVGAAAALFFGLGSASAMAAPAVDVSITKTDGSTQATAGAYFVYTVVVTNNSATDAALNVVMTDPLPASLSLSSVSSPNDWNCTSSTTSLARCTNPSMAANASATFSIGVHLSSAATGTLVNTAGVAADNNENIANDSATDTNNIISLAPPVPTLSEWAMILMGLMLAGGAALVLQRRRLTV